MNLIVAGNNSIAFRLSQIMVPGPGLEPGRCCHRGILSPLRLPISPSGQLMEARVGIEPAYTELQSAA